MLTWEPAFFPLETPNMPQLRDVRAATYDSARGIFIVLDHQTGTPGTYRLLQIDRAAGMISVLASFNAENNAAIFELANDGSGGFLMSRTIEGATSFVLYHFRADNNALAWLGRVNGTGTLLPGLHASPAGQVVQLIERDGKLGLGPTAFTADTRTPNWL